MLCNICGADIGDALGLCQQCTDKRAKRVELLGSQIQTQTATDTRAKLIKAFGGVAAVLFVALIVVLLVDTEPSSLPETPLMSNHGYEQSICTSGNACFVAYMTPWCPHCRSAVPFVNKLSIELQRKDGIELVVVVGSSSEDKLAKFGNDFNGTVFYDPSSKFKREAGIRGVPGWLGVNEKRQIVGSQSGRYVGGSFGTQVKALFNKLNLEKFG